ncbi:MAG: hypothetical protein H0T83_06540 [Chthoniobacterales bacterium]|nr:hypothetical protein [Chthoniobacterales bacterium]
MDANGTLLLVIFLLGVTAAGGLVMAGIRVFAQHNPPAWLALLHGLLAIAGLTLLVFATFTVGVPAVAQWALVLLLIAAAGGVVMNLGYQWKQMPLPKPLMYLHAGIAAVGFGLLIAGALG